jgi:hypothetical protein
VLRASDIINLLMEIEGVVAINNLVLSKYDTEGNLVKGVSVPTWVGGNPVFDSNRTSAQWLLFYHRRSSAKVISQSEQVSVLQKTACLLLPEWMRHSTP